MSPRRHVAPSVACAPNTMRGSPFTARNAMPRRPAEALQPLHAHEDRALVARVLRARPLPGVTGGSALLDVDGRLLAVHDDAFRVSWVSLPSFDVTALVLAGDGAPLAKTDKPDFESAVRTADGAIHVLGSGSSSRRCMLARIDPQTSAVALRHRPRLYRCVQDALGSGERPNIEGAIVAGDRLRLFNRAAGRTPNATIDLPVEVLDGAAPRALAFATFELGELDGVRLGFTDAALLRDGRCVFVAAAEDAPDAIADGPVMGSVVGLLEPDARGATARLTRLVASDGRPSADKVEGMAIDADARSGWLLTDSDDERVPAELLRIELVGFD